MLSDNFSTTPSGAINNFHNLYLDTTYLEDNVGLSFLENNLFYERYKFTDTLGFGIHLGNFYLQQENVAKYSGIRYGASLLVGHFELMIHKNDYDDFNEIVPTIKYTNIYKSNSYNLEYTKQNALFYTYSLKAYEKRISAQHFSASNYIAFSKTNDLWANIVTNLYSNKDTEITGQFDYRFLLNTIILPKLTYNLALEGWYTSHSKQHDDFYSPKFSDSTMLRLDTYYTFNKYARVKANIGTGYSTEDQTQPFKYGLWLSGKPLDDFSYEIGCLQSNSARISVGPAYEYKECKLNLGYLW